MVLLVQALVSLVFSVSHRLQWLLRCFTTVLFFRRRSSKPRHLLTTGSAAAAGFEWQLTLFLMYIFILLGVVLLLLPRVFRAVSSHLRRADLRRLCSWCSSSLPRRLCSRMLDPGFWRRPHGARRPQLPHNLPRKFSLRELEVATSKFSDKKRLGSGSFGVVFKGTLADGGVIAVKKLNFSVVSGGGSESEDETRLQFENEARLLQLRHGNIVQLLGYCCEKQQWLLCYEHMARGSLDKFLFRRLS